MMHFWQRGRVRLRALELKDLDFFYTLNQDTERNKLIDWLKPPQSKKVLKAWLKEKLGQGLSNYGYQWMIESVQAETLGSVVTHSCDARTGSFSYALDIAPEFQRQGYATDAITVVLSYYFGELRFQKVTVAVASNNAASLALHQKLGFKHEGSIRRVVFSGGEFHNLEWFGQTAEEFWTLTASRKSLT